MTIMISPEPSWDTNRLLAEILSRCANEARVQFLVEPRADANVVQRLRVALSRSRKRNKRFGKKVVEFTLRHSIHPHTQDGKRHSCIVMWIERHPHHVQRELLDDLMERDS